jgi:hypothetical protein
MSVAPHTLLWEELLKDGSHWSGVLRRGSTLRLIAAADDANVAALFYSREQPLERYNMADTLKAQHTAMLTTGCVGYSDMGRVLFGITDDSCGWHDPLCGLSSPQQIDALYGPSNFQQHRNDRHISAREGMLVELGKYGLGERDLVASLNFFSKAVADEQGRLSLAPGHCRSGQQVDLRIEMDCIVALHAGPHPLARTPPAKPADVLLQLWRSAPRLPDDPCATRCPENARGYLNTDRLYLA